MDSSIDDSLSTNNNPTKTHSPNPSTSTSIPNSDSTVVTSSYRTLNVRDALSYLDQVKIRFQDQNEVYNQFLDVMKLFKTQSIDTPGVIERVSSLFRGYPSLIQGFNTFLPSGFRIECTLLKRIDHDSNPELADLVTVLTPNPITNKTSLFPRDGSHAIIIKDRIENTLTPMGWIEIKDSPETGSTSTSINSTSYAQHQTTIQDLTQPPQPPLPPSHPSKHKQINNHSTSSSTTPTTSTNMNSKSSLNHDEGQSKLTDPLITANLNQTNSNKTTNTNPTANTITHSAAIPYRPNTTASSSTSLPSHSTHNLYSNSNPTSNSKLPVAPDLKALDSTSNHHQMLLAPELVAEPIRSHSNQPAITRTPTPVVTVANPPQANSINNKPVEFNYAINYVNKIKHRFIDQPEIYKTFLEILQTYQRDGMPIDVVYVQVTKLFAEATDLLDEFKQFLPDPNNENGASGVTMLKAQAPVPKPSQSTLMSTSQTPHSMLIDDRLSKPFANSDLASDLRRHTPSPGTRVMSGVSLLSDALAPTLNKTAEMNIRNTTNAPLVVRPEIADLPTTHTSSARPLGVPVHPKNPINGTGPSKTFLPTTSPSNKRPLASSHNTEADETADHSKESGPLNKKKKIINDHHLSVGGPLDSTPPSQLDTVASKMSGTKANRSRNKYQEMIDPVTKVSTQSTHHEPNPHTTPFRTASQHHLHKSADTSVDDHLQHHDKRVSSRSHHQITTEEILPDNYLWHTHRLETHDAMGGRTLTNTKELILFESIKKYLNDTEVWHEFLRVLELYNQTIIDFKTLVDRVSVYIGDNDELLDDFKGFVGYDVKKDGLVEDEVWEIKNLDVREREKVDASIIQREYGPSYKRLPKCEIDLACSGRDELCWSVLNDEYFGAAKFGTESGGPGHRKTNFEEVIAMTEGERAHFSYWSESMSRTIGHLESLQTRIDSMDEKERLNFQLGENLGGISPSIYNRTLKKFIKEIEEFKEKKECLVIDVVLADEPNPSVIQKPLNDRPKIDKKSVKNKTTSKPKPNPSHALYSTIPEPEVMKIPPMRPSHQVELGFQDLDVFFDVLKIIAMSLDRSALSHPERRRIDETIRILIPAVWNISQIELEKQIPMIYDDESSESTTDEINPNRIESSNHGQENERDLNSKKGIESLTRGLLELDSTNESNGARGRIDRMKLGINELETPLMSSPPNSVPTLDHQPLRRNGFDLFDSNGEENKSNDEHHTFSVLRKWADIQLEGEDGDEEMESSVSNHHGRYFYVFGTSTYVILFRLIHILYSRLLKLKTTAIEIGIQEPNWKRINPIGIELGLSHPILGLDDDENQNPSEKLYGFVLDSISRLFDGELEINSFEELIRIGFPKIGYLVSTIDKLSNSILKHFSHLHSDTRNKEMLNLLRREREREREEESDDDLYQFGYRNEVNEIIEDGELYKAEWHPERKSLSIQLINSEDPTIEISKSSNPLKYYIKSYQTEIDTETIDPTNLNKSFRTKNLMNLSLGKWEGKSKYKISKSNFKLKVLKSTEDCWISKMYFNKFKKSVENQDEEEEEEKGEGNRKLDWVGKWVDERWKEINEEHS
ncbi:uncharacterized protein MELLADRAFT_77776 [Melampsora larici-populina 98AG31]|uniref:Histone deacetylase interacting domain-containing protein n=1 Tax=Melampsora larici-populina (strain 98AG31 / pathotype 3-4-7) TaxID=747676 RepID=F4RLQ0_MELLP|nr:uncharacterized protein MELLADRAFT_77776 [Melampsora larici-populina 98AG31]EGG06573.1 hypothetical protein MELLADRAFT_77776 [Melampsora larici-populina 98AG31]